MFDSLKSRLESFIKKTGSVAEKKAELTTKTKLKSVLTKRIRLSDTDIENIVSELELDLVQNDVAMETTERIVQRLRNKLTAQEIAPGEVDRFVRNALKEVLMEIIDFGEFSLVEEIRKSDKPYTILFLGVNGTGKTTTIAKVADYLIRNGFSVVLAAGDTFRAGAIEQIDKHAKNLGVKVISHQKGADAAAVVFDAIAHAKARKIDVVLADSAGRMQTNINLMDELSKIVRVNKPNLKIFVGDALTGNDAVEQAREFNEKVEVDAVILTKMDADAKGGSALSIANEIRKPIILVGMGQSYSDLKEFDKNWYIESIV